MSPAIPVLPRISDYPSWHAQRQPAAIAMTVDDSAISYARFTERIEDLARALLALGVRKGDRVATLQSPHPEFFIAFLATASIGAIWLGLNPRYRRDELQRALLDAAPVVLLTRTIIGERCYQHDLEALRAQTPSLRQIVIFDGDPPLPGTMLQSAFLGLGQKIALGELEAARAACGADDPCLIVYTSGSSGTPKGALLHHRAIVEMSLALNRLWPVEPHRIVNYFPINHLGCVVDCSTPCLVAGGSLHFLEQFDPAACLELMAREHVTLWGSVPSAFQLQLDLESFSRYDLSAVQLIVWGGAAMPETLIRRLLISCRRLATNYGMTETTSVITISEPTDDVEVLAHSVGRCLPGVEVRLANSDDAAVTAGEPGEVQVRSRYNFCGYWGQPKASAAAFTADGFFRTGDLAICRPDGRYRLVGRLGEMYKSGGYNVYPREIETVLESHPAVALCAVVAVPDPLWQEVGIAFVSTREPVSATELEMHCDGRMARYKLPKRFVIRRDLPLLPIGKVDKAALREQARREYATRT